MANEERVILTDVGITIPRISRWERITLKVALSAGKRMVNATLSLAGKEDLVLPTGDMFDGARTLVEIADDFESGAISGKVVTSTSQEQLINRSDTFDPYTLIKARQRAKNRKFT